MKKIKPIVLLAVFVTSILCNTTPIQANPKIFEMLKRRSSQKELILKNIQRDYDKLNLTSLLTVIGELAYVHHPDSIERKFSVPLGAQFYKEQLEEYYMRREYLGAMIKTKSNIEFQRRQSIATRITKQFSKSKILSSTPPASSSTSLSGFAAR